MERLQDKVEPKYVGFLRSILQSGQHLLSIINDILDLSKIEAGKMEIYPESFPVRPAIESVCQVMKGMSAKKGITFEVDAAQDIEIEADHAKFKQILYNLLSNAVKFSKSNSVVTIRARASDPVLIVSVIDRGIGIAPDHQALPQMVVVVTRISASPGPACGRDTSSTRMSPTPWNTVARMVLVVKGFVSSRAG